LSGGDAPAVPRRREYDTVVVGAGIIGCAIAFELSKRGYRTLNVDRLPAAGYGPTSNSCAIVRLHYSSLQGVAMAWESYFHWEHWQEYLGVVDDFGTARFVDTGVILLKSATGHHQKSLEHYNELGIPYEDWDAGELERRCPLYDVGAFYPPKALDDPAFNAPPKEKLPGAIFTPQAGFVVDGLLSSHNVQRAAEAAGGEFLFRAEVMAIRRDGERVRGVTLDDGTEINASVVVNVAGPHSELVNRLAGIGDEMAVKTRALRHEVHHVPAPPGVDYGATGIMTSDGDLGIYFRPEGDNHILVGSEDPPCDGRMWVDDPSVYNREVTRKQWERQVLRLARRIPSLPIPHERKGVVDLYDVSDDWIPIYDCSSLPGYYMAIGSSGNQFKTAPVAGKLMATLIERVEAGHDHDEEPVTMACDYIDFEVDAGFYSRRRQVVASSSFSVVG
jgi:sarcosine oxidase, subunit beta